VHKLSASLFTEAAHSPGLATQVSRSFFKNFSTDGCYPKNDARQKGFESDLLDFIAVDGVPMDVVSKVGFVKMIKNINQCLRVPSRRTIGRQLSTKFRTVSSN
jgi:hypothetical protein